MLRAVPKNWFSWKFEIFDGEVCVANLDLSEYVPGGRAFFSVSAIQGRTFEIFLEEYKKHESWIDGVKELFHGTDEPPTLLREDGRTIVSAKRLDCNSDKSPFEVVFDQTVYQLNPVNMSLLDRLTTGIYIRLRGAQQKHHGELQHGQRVLCGPEHRHIPLKLPPFELRKSGRVVGSIRPARRWLTRKAIVELPEYLPLEVQVFITGLVLCRWMPNTNDHRESE